MKQVPLPAVEFQELNSSFLSYPLPSLFFVLFCFLFFVLFCLLPEGRGGEGSGVLYRR